MSDRFALTGARIFDGETWHDDAALLVRDGLVEAIVPTGAMPPDAARDRRLGGGMLAPGFVDLQVNGGGGVMLNDQPDARDASGPSARRMRRSARRRCCRR